MYTERFRLTFNPRNMWEIIDQDQDILTIYNDLGDTCCSSAPQLCELLNDLNNKTLTVHEISEIEKTIIGLDELTLPFQDTHSKEEVINTIKELLTDHLTSFKLYSLIVYTMITNDIMQIIKTKYYNGEEIQIKIKAQEKYCGDDTPLFAPEDGVCDFCGKQIYTHITLEKASTELITGCPHCSHTFCD